MPDWFQPVLLAQCSDVAQRVPTAGFHVRCSLRQREARHLARIRPRRTQGYGCARTAVRVDADGGSVRPVARRSGRRRRSAPAAGRDMRCPWWLARERRPEPARALRGGPRSRPRRPARMRAENRSSPRKLAGRRWVVSRKRVQPTPASGCSGRRLRQWPRRGDTALVRDEGDQVNQPVAAVSTCAA
jgi:hypothetical protein